MHSPVYACDAREVTVIARAHGERGRSVPPSGIIGRAFQHVLDLLQRDGRLSRVADPRLAALRLSGDATCRRGGIPRQEPIDLLASGSSAPQIRLLLGTAAVSA